MTIQNAYQYLIEKLQSVYDAAEAGNIAIWVLESVTTYDKLLQKVHEYQMLTGFQKKQLEDYTEELLKHRPVQYVLGECYFMDMKLFVDENVLVPRPETEELVDWIIKHCKSENIKNLAILDIGTGSGCIALALKKYIPQSAITAIDISQKALNVAEKNADTLKLTIDCKQCDILDAIQWNDLPEFDIIVSNPPYITLPEKESMMPNVLEYEPHRALFVTDDDPQQFYKAIASFAAKKMKPSGAVFMELHRDFAKDTQAYYEQKNWKTNLRQDMQGNDRMLMVWK